MQPRNIGVVPNHNFVVEQARGELFKWAADDDLYARDLLRRCVDALDEDPHVALAHSRTAMIDSAGTVDPACTTTGWRRIAARAPSGSEACCSTAATTTHMASSRTEVLRRTALHGSYHFADLTIVTEIGLHGPFYQIPDWLYFRREHPERPPWWTVRDRCAATGPAAGRPAAPSGCPPVRRIPLGLRRGDPGCAAVVCGPAGVLPLPSALDGEPGSPGGGQDSAGTRPRAPVPSEDWSQTRRSCCWQAVPSRSTRSWPGRERKLS